MRTRSSRSKWVSPSSGGQEIARLGDFPSNGDWPPHLHFQLITDLLDREGDFPGRRPSESRSECGSAFPQIQGLMLDLPPGSRYEPPVGANALRSTRRSRLGPSLSLSYREPLHIVRGWRQHLFDAGGRRTSTGSTTSVMWGTATLGWWQPRADRWGC